MFDEADQTAPEPRKTGRDNTSTACLFWLLVSTNTEADVRMLCKRFWCWFSLDFVENLVQCRVSLQLADLPQPTQAASPAKWLPGITAAQNIHYRQGDAATRHSFRGKLSRQGRGGEHYHRKRNWADQEWEKASWQMQMRTDFSSLPYHVGLFWQQRYTFVKGTI